MNPSIAACSAYVAWMLRLAIATAATAVKDGVTDVFNGERSMQSFVLRFFFLAGMTRESKTILSHKCYNNLLPIFSAHKNRLPQYATA